MRLTLIRVLIVEDQPNLRNEICRLVAQDPSFEVAGACGTVEEAKALIQSKKPDLLLLDVQLPDGTGFDVLKSYPGEIKTIFLTAFEKHAIRAIKSGALDYLLKPLDEEEFSEALRKVAGLFPAQYEQAQIASRYHQDQVRSKLVLRSQEYLHIVELIQIVYCQSDSGYTTFHLENNRKILVSKVLKTYEDILTEPMFLRPHQSYVVNLEFIDRYHKGEGKLILKNGVEIPVAERRRETIMELINRL